MENKTETAAPRKIATLGVEFVRAKLAEARKHLVGVRETQQRLEEIAVSLSNEVRELEAEERSLGFQANATMLRDLFYPFPMSARDEDIRFIARKGDRVQAVPGRYDFSPVLITTAEGKQHEVDGAAVQPDAPPPAASQAV